MPAYEKLAQDLESLKTGNNYAGFTSLPNGKEYFTYRMKSAGFSVTPEKAMEMLDTNLQIALSVVMDAIFADSNLLTEYNKYDFSVNHKSAQDGFDYLEVEAAEDFPPLPNVSPILKTVDPSMEDLTSPAFYFTPRVDDMDTNIIYINNKSGTKDLFQTLAHEGYPGHMMQFTSFYATAPSDLSKYLTFNSCVEGWAKYVEDYALKYEKGLSKEVVTLMQHDSRFSTLLQARIEIGVNYQGWTKQDIYNYMGSLKSKTLGLSLAMLYNVKNADDEMIEYLYQSAIERPVYSLVYGLGQLELEQIKEIYIQQNGASELEFHEAFLNVGPTSFPMLRKYLGIDAD